MHGKVKRFTVWVPFDKEQIHLEGDNEVLIPYFQNLVVCMPHLTHLDFRMNVPDVITNRMAAILSSLPSLQSLILQNDHLKSPTVSDVFVALQPGVIQSVPLQVCIFFSIRSPYSFFIACSQRKSSPRMPSWIVLIMLSCFKYVPPICYRYAILTHSTLQVTERDALTSSIDDHLPEVCVTNSRTYHSLTSSSPQTKRNPSRTPALTF